MAKRRDKVEWVCGWWHDFVSPKDGSFLTWTPDEPGPETLHSRSDPKVALTPKLHAAWVYSFRINNGNRMAEAARLFRLTGDRKYADWAAGQLDFYADNFEKWPLSVHGGTSIWSSKSRLFWQSLDEATNLTRHVEAARLIWDTVTPQRRQNWRDKLFGPQAEMLGETFQSIHNIACWQRSAMGHVALLYGDADLWRKAVDAPFGIRDQLAQGVTSDYFWYEQSLGYNDYVVLALLPFFLTASLLGRERELAREMQIVENLMLAPLALRFPNGDLPSPADGGRRKAPTLSLMADTSRISPTTAGLYETEKTASWGALIDPTAFGKPHEEKAPALPLPRSRSLETTRMALIRKDGWQVYFHYGQRLQSHAQAEALNYEAWHGDVTDLTHDTATVGYGSPLHKDYYTQGLAHNVPLVGGIGQVGWSLGELLEWSPEKGCVSARQPKYQPGVQATRTLTASGEKFTDIAKIELTDAALPDAPLGLTVHLQGKAVLSGDWVPEPDITSQQAETVRTAIRFRNGHYAAYTGWHAGFTHLKRGHIVPAVRFLGGAAKRWSQSLKDV